jgi:hypothetical protein
MVLQYFVLFICVGSVCVCALAIFVELSASFAYYGRAFKFRYVGKRKPKLRSEYEAKKAARLPLLQRIAIRLRCKKPKKPKPSLEGAVVTNASSIAWRQSNSGTMLHPADARRDSVIDLSSEAMRRDEEERKATSLAAASVEVQHAHVMTPDELKAHRAKMMEMAEVARTDKVREVSSSTMKL